MSPATPSPNIITSYYSRTPSIFGIASFFSAAVYTQRLFYMICKFQWLLEPTATPELIITAVQPCPANLPLSAYRQLSPRFTHVAASPFVLLCIYHCSVICGLISRTIGSTKGVSFTALLQNPSRKDRTSMRDISLCRQVGLTLLLYL